MQNDIPVRTLEIKSKLDWEGASYDLTHRIEIRDITEEIDEGIRERSAGAITLPGPADTKAILNELYALAAAAKGILITARAAAGARERAEYLSGAEGALDMLIEKGRAFGMVFGVAICLVEKKKKAGKGGGKK